MTLYFITDLTDEGCGRSMLQSETLIAQKPTYAPNCELTLHNTEPATGFTCTGNLDRSIKHKKVGLPLTNLWPHSCC